MLDNSGVISGGAVGYNQTSRNNPGAGGNGVDLAVGGSLTNSGLITGGTGGYAYYVSGPGGIGVSAAGGTLTNTGTGGAGGVGIALAGSAASSLINSGIISGGTGGSAYFGLHGGAGIQVEARSDLTLVNSGTISGGNGGSSYYPNIVGAAGGAGVYFSPSTGGTLINAGTITGGMGGMAHSGRGAMGAAVQFGTRASTLVIDPGAVFRGRVIADTAAQDTLVLAGTAAGTLSGLGTAFTGFATAIENAKSDWLLAQTNTLDPGATLRDAGVLSVTGTLADAGSATIAQGGLLQALATGVIQIDSVTLAGGTLAEQAASQSTIAIGAAQAGAQAGSITVQSDGAISGFGTITAATLADRGSIIAQGGTLSLAAATSGPGSLTITPNATLLAGSAMNAASLIFAPGGEETLILDAPTSVTATLYGYASHDVIDLKNYDVKTAAFSHGSLILNGYTSNAATLPFQGTYTTTNFAFSSDGHGGTNITYVSAPAPTSDYLMRDFAPSGLDGAIASPSSPAWESNAGVLDTRHVEGLIVMYSAWHDYGRIA